MRPAVYRLPAAVERHAGQGQIHSRRRSGHVTKLQSPSIQPSLQFADRSLPILVATPENSSTEQNFSPETSGSRRERKGVTVGSALLRLLRHPNEALIKKWNWKSAILSTVLRSVLFFFTNLKAGLPAALAALTTEWVYRGVTSGFYGALTQALSDIEPPWAGALAVLVLLPIANHSVEFFVHWLRGTSRLYSSIGASVALTALSSLFNYYAMRRGSFTVGHGRKALLHDLGQFPRLVVEFCVLPARWVRRWRRKSTPGKPRNTSYNQLLPSQFRRRSHLL